MKVGYQGIKGSNSEQAAKNLCEKLNLTDYELEPLVTSRGVVGALKRKEVDLGVIAVKNRNAGIVEESQDALRIEHLEFLASELLNIHHAVFVKGPEIKVESIKSIRSHPQALRQCEKNISETFKNAVTEDFEDTALSAEYLSNGRFGEDTAIICNKEAGIERGLHLLYEDFEDSIHNETEFRMFRYIDQNNQRAATSFLDKLMYHSITDKGLGYITKGLMVLFIFGALYIQQKFDFSSYDVATILGGVVSAIFIFITSEKLRNWFRYRSLTGYWKYYSIPDNEIKENDDPQKYEIPRIVKTAEIDGQLQFTGWMADKENVILFKSQKVLVSSLGARKGSLVYWYNSPNELSREFDLHGIVTLEWELEHPASAVHTMAGWYMGKASNQNGSLKYVRISKREFEALQKSDYL